MNSADSRTHPINQKIRVRLPWPPGNIRVEAATSPQPRPLFMSARTGGLLEYLHRLLSQQSAAPAVDAELLDRFLRRRDETAFTELVKRHGPMVQRVCRRVLADADAANDASQA